MSERAPIENISFSFICDKNWDKMQPCSSGRHCADCDRKVIDFTNKSIEELHEALEMDGKVCGRFHRFQLSKTPSQKSFSFTRVAASILLAIGFSAFSKELQAQVVSCTSLNHNHNEAQSEMAFGMVGEIMPVYKQGGEQGMLEFIQKNLQYPPNKSVEGIVVASFVIDTSGNVTEPAIIKSLSDGADKEALRVVKLMEFYPGMRGGKKIPVRYTLPIRFSDDRRKKK